MSAAAATVIVIAKRPVPGRVKTRLTPPLTPGQAADVAAAALHDTLDAVDTVAARCGAGRLLAFDGDPTGWARPGWTVVAQVDGGLDARLVAAFEAVPAGPAVLVGMDTPQLRPAHLDVDLAGHDACLGLACDGGYWAIGFADPAQARATISGVPMSRADTGARQLARLAAAGLAVQHLPELADVDDVTTARAVAGLVPGSRFAAALDAALAVPLPDSTVPTTDARPSGTRR